MDIKYEKLRVDENCLFHYQEFRQKHFTSPLHLHDEFELIWIVKSHGKLYAGNGVTNFADGDVFLFAPGIPHCFINSRGYEDGGEIANAIVIQFRHDFLGRDFFEKTETYKLKKLISLSGSGILFLNTSNQFKKRMKMGKPGNLRKLGDLLFILNELASTKEYKLLTGGSPVPNLIDSRVINDVIQYVAGNFQKNLSLEQAAEIANMQKSAFCRYFKRKTKKKFMEFVNETRLTHAQKLLVESDKNILEIAYECGYESASYFYRLFKQANHMSPVTYRKQFSTWSKFE